MWNWHWSTPYSLCTYSKHRRAFREELRPIPRRQSWPGSGYARQHPRPRQRLILRRLQAGGEDRLDEMELLVLHRPGHPKEPIREKRIARRQPARPDPISILGASRRNFWRNSLKGREACKGIGCGSEALAGRKLAEGRGMALGQFPAARRVRKCDGQTGQGQAGALDESALDSDAANPPVGVQALCLALTHAGTAVGKIPPD